MYSIGEKVVYGSTGVCTIIDIRTPDIDGARQSYVLKPDYLSNSTIYAPVDNNRVAIRSLQSPEQVEQLIDSMQHMSPMPETKDRQELYQNYREAVKSTDCNVLAQLLKTLYEKKKLNKHISSAETELFANAEAILFGEMATSLRIPLDAVMGYIDNRLGVA